NVDPIMPAPTIPICMAAPSSHVVLQARPSVKGLGCRWPENCTIRCGRQTMKLFNKARVFAGTLIVSGVLFAAPAHAATRVYVRIGPPAPVYERAVIARPGYVWVPGYHRWNGHRYVWVSGHSVRAPRRHSRWIPGHWSHER